MVLGVKHERDGVTDRGVDGSGLEGKLAAVTDCNLEIFCGDDGDEAGQGNGSEGEMHFDCLLGCFV